MSGSAVSERSKPEYIRLGVNVDHIATLRQARRGREPDPLAAAAAAELGGADHITVHLLENRKHIQDRDVRMLRETVQTGLNLEVAVIPEFLELCLAVRPDQAMLMPDQRKDGPTIGGLDVRGRLAEVANAAASLKAAGLTVAVFVDPDLPQLEAAHSAGVDNVVFYGGAYSRAWKTGKSEEWQRERERFVVCGREARARGMGFHITHGLDYRNVQRIRDLEGLEAVNIGHAITSRAVFVGLENAVRQMKALLSGA